MGEQDAGARTVLPELFKQKHALQCLRPSSPLKADMDHETEFSAPPKLLQRLEALLEDKLSLVRHLGTDTKGFAQAQLQTDAYRQVFDALLHSFTTYRPLLARIKQEYDSAVDDSLASLYDNLHMKAELAIVGQRTAAAIEEAQILARQDASVTRKDLQDQITQQEQAVKEVEQKCQTSELQIQQCRAATAGLRARSEKLQQHAWALKRQLLTNSSWNNPDLLAKYQI